MARVTNQSSGGPSDTASQPEVWYGFTLKDQPELEAKGTPGYKGQPRKHVRAQLVWVLDGTEDWVFDWIDLTVKSQQNGTPSRCAELICALTNRNARLEEHLWIDDETCEFGFDANQQQVAGQLTPGVRVAAKGMVGADQQGNARLNINAYAPITMVAQRPAPAPQPTSPQQADLI